MQEQAPNAVEKAQRRANQGRDQGLSPERSSSAYQAVHSARRHANKPGAEKKVRRRRARLAQLATTTQLASSPLRSCWRRSGTKSGSTQRHKTVQSQPSTGQVLRAALTSVATPVGPLGPVGFGLNSVPGQPARTLPPQMMSSTQPQHLVDLHATSAYVDEFDCEDALNETHELPTSQPHILDSSGPARLTAQPTAMVPTLSQTEQLGRLGGSLRLESGGDVAPPVPFESTYAQQHQVPPARPAEPPAVAVGSTLTKEDLIDFADQMKSVRWTSALCTT